MKQKKLFILAAAAALLAACSSDDGITAEKQAAQQAAQQEVGFSAYVNRGTTRAGDAGILDTGAKSPNVTGLRKYGFGVFAYYTDGVPYGETATPDFMYNQKVSCKDGDETWYYTPIKYWPNEFGTNAESEGKDKLTFFAYAPYVTVIPGTGRIDTNVHTEDNALTSGIVGMTSNVATGDPYIKYYVDFDPDNSVDLCWGVAKTDFSSSVVSSLNNKIAGEPYIDVLKPQIQTGTGAKINFDFKHALASLNVQIDAAFDEVSSASLTNDRDKNTRIWVRSVTFEGFTDKGSLNLNASATVGPLWYELSSTNTLIGSGSVTIYDGRRDGKEAQSNATASNEKPFNLNASLVQKYAYQNPYNESNGLTDNHGTKGVTKTAVNLFDCETLDKPIFVIPTGEELKVTIVYDVETYDPNVAGYLADGVTKGSVVENKISKNIKISSSNVKLEAGNAYTVKLHLGMTSVQFEASVSPWTPQTASDTDLPINNN